MRKVAIRELGGLFIKTKNPPGRVSEAGVERVVVLYQGASLRAVPERRPSQARVLRRGNMMQRKAWPGATHGASENCRTRICDQTTAWSTSSRSRLTSVAEVLARN